ncbi:ABC transporter substrate-binding protein [Streptomyces sp. GC420]|uniref:ABC transporter substrate-binding protein n=1 Tax=Streptomyces sp. GC420 TaxID=2697568 RepID=UPI001414DA33|nr:ABC transporter substrate-binding protein [Streptomyces sp. GC420]NBM18629.1 ABC transporter substrate-binding protein [Streptomyces sp. GC420]
MRPLVPIATLVLSVSLTATACGSPSASSGDGPIKLGLIASLTGNYQPLGTDNKKSVELAVQQINADGGVLGRKIELQVKDDKSQPDQSVLAFNNMKDDVTAVIGSPFSNSALATIPVVDWAKVPYLSLTPADEQVDPIHPYVFLAPATSNTYAERLLQYYKATGVKKIAVAYDTKSSYAVAGYRGTKELAAEHGVKVVATETFQTTSTDFNSMFTHIKRTDAQALLVWATGAPGVIITKQYAASGLDVPLALTGAQASKLWAGPAGKAAEGVTVASSVGVVADQLPKSKLTKTAVDFAQAFNQEYGENPPQFAQDGYSAVQLLVAAIEKAGSTDHEKIRDALEGMTLTTPNGTYRYGAKDHSGLTADYISVNTFEDGAFVPTEWARAELAKGAEK